MQKHILQIILKMTYFKQSTNEHSTSLSIGSNEDFSKTTPDVYFPQVMRNGMLEGIESNILHSWSFLYPNGYAGLMQNFIVLDELAKRLGSSIWHYKINTWNLQAGNLNVMTNRTYRFFKYTLKPFVSKIADRGKRVFDIHLTPYSAIVVLAAEANRFKHNLCHCVLPRFFCVSKKLFCLFSCQHEQNQKPCLFYFNIKRCVLSIYNMPSCFLGRLLRAYNKLGSFL